MANGALFPAKTDRDVRVITQNSIVPGLVRSTARQPPTAVLSLGSLHLAIIEQFIELRRSLPCFLIVKVKISKQLKILSTTDSLQKF
jgi:hypothetical protein